MGKLPVRRNHVMAAAAAIVALAGGAIVARSPGARASLRAAYVGFRDPSRVRVPSSGSIDDAPPVPPPPDLDQPELAGDFGRVGEADLADAGSVTLASLVVPDLQIPISQRTMRFLAYFAASEKGREAFAARYRRAGRYRAHIEQALRDAELPEDLVWLVAIESAFEPQATSPKGAAGLFQFMPETGARYGLAQSDLLDERRSVPRSTAAAVALLRDLYDVYGRWDLALAAYNFGRDNLDDAIARLAMKRGPRETGKPIELKDLADARLIPKETANFVPQIQAFGIVAANRGRFGLDDLDVAPPFDFAELAVPPNTPLSLVARAAGISIALVRDYNPGLLRDRTPPDGGDTLVCLPADRIASALAAFPALLAREAAKAGTATSATSTPEPRVRTARAEPRERSGGEPSEGPPARKPRDAPPAPAAQPSERSDRWTLSNGVVIERRATSAADVTIAARIEIARPGGRAFDVEPVTVRPADLDAGLARAAQAIHALAADAGDAAIEARRRAGEARRERLSRAPYGSAWIALGERLFGAGHPLAGTVLASPALPLTSVATAELPAPAALLRVTVSVAGPTSRGPLGEAAERVLRSVLEARAMVAVYPREDRIALVEAVPSPRVVFGWLAPTPSDDDRAALRLAMMAVANNEAGKVAHALVAERFVAVHVRGFVDLGERASVASIEVVPGVRHDAAEVERELDAAFVALGERGLSASDLAAAKAQLRVRVQLEQGRAGTTGEPRDVVLAKLARLLTRTEATTSDELVALVKRVFVPGHRVVITTSPRG